jgi:hypothetical protein
VEGRTEAMEDTERKTRTIHIDMGKKIREINK